MTRNADLSKAFKALANSNRLRLYLEIMQRQNQGMTAESGCPLAELIPALKIGAPTVSHHIKELVNANLIRIEREGKFMRCYLNDSMRHTLAVFFAKR